MDARWENPYGVVGQAPQTTLRRLIRKGIHFFAYHLILNRRSTRHTKAAGFSLAVGPTVFHPKLFLTSEFFAGAIGMLDLRGKTVAEVGTGSGILSLAAARAGAAHVIAIDINPNAAQAAAHNAGMNGLDAGFSAVCGDLLNALAPRPLFDVIISSPPSFPGEPRSLADRAWVAGPNYRDIRALFSQAAERLKPNGRMYVLWSSDSDLELLGRLTQLAGFSATQIAERSIGFEKFYLYELQKRRDDASAPACAGALADASVA